MVSPGILVTNHHVVERCERLDIVSLDGRRTGVVLDKDESVDLALVRVTGLGGVVAVLRRPGSVRLGEPAYAFGFPLAGLLSEGGNFTNGVVSGLRGMRDSANEIQITTPVQPGNSGGAVIDSSGNVMGVVVSKLNAAAVAKATGDIPQNVNFAVSIAALTDFLGRNKVSYRTAERGTSIDSAQLADMARSVSHRIVCTGQVTADRRGSGSQTDNDSGDTTVILWNQSTEAIFSVFVSPVSSDKWGVDQLGREVISPGGRFTLKPPASQGCTYDVRVEFKSGKHQEKRNQNFCRMVDLKIDG
jgi:S1-C subfamily serine protease